MFEIALLVTTSCVLCGVWNEYRSRNKVFKIEGADLALLLRRKKYHGKPV